MTNLEPVAAVPLPSGSRVIHIGPSKTGTTSLQAALWDARTRLEEQGVHYAGGSRHSATAVRAGARIRDMYRDDASPPPEWMWKGLVREIRTARADRVVLSSEFLAHADEGAIRSIAQDLDPERVQIVITLRPIARMLSSLWQQQLQTGGRSDFTRWLERNLGREGDLPNRRLWHRHRHDGLIGRWGAVFGMHRLTVVIVDSSDRQRILRDVESLLAVRPGTLRLDDSFNNRSLTLPEARALVVLNQQLAALAAGRVDNLYVVREGVSPLLKLRTPGPGEARIRLPAWAGDRAARLAETITDGIAASGVRVIGDLSVLTQVPETVPEEDPDDHLVPDDIPASMAIGVAFAAGMLRHSKLARERRLAEAVEMRYLSTRDLVRLPLARLVRFGPRLLRWRIGRG
jgi:hypothetical protein